MSFKKSVGVLAFGSALTIALYGVGCGGSGKGSGGGSSGSGGSTGSGSGGTHGSGSGGSTGSGSGGTHGSGGSKGSGGTMGIVGFDGGDTGSPMTCSPASVTSFTGSLNTSAIGAGMCTATQITNIINDCINQTDAMSTACTDLLADTATKTCYQMCINTPWTADTSGATFMPPTAGWGAQWYMTWGTGTNLGFFEQPNIGGCYAAAGATACATAWEENQECWMQACAANCPLPPNTDPSFPAAQNAISGCIKTTETGSGGCVSYGSKITSACMSSMGADSGLVGMCNDAVNILFATTPPTLAKVVQAYTELFTVVCGPPAGGGG
jgi:hypothetical protein